MPVQPREQAAGQLVDRVFKGHLPSAAGEFAEAVAAFGGHFHVPAAAFDRDIEEEVAEALPQADRASQPSE